ncbi:hypothetical protein PV08_02989 [Exophiala spinifera]|uniref:Mmc1 C-terminal domain-containing protein n=1 Tax=Exophiala spinifera TaxID=91928 RepID=A0A0D2BJC4_9EURO|nr:uncharacterized protein PV08_02989 [Exophiala spinifera]KIW18700.1 hypothetical protein PV08_02989 [Exophiala spinifera]
MKRPTRPRSHEQLEFVVNSLFFCPSCTIWRTARPLRCGFRRALSTTRRNSAIPTSHTAVNATKSVPARYKPLHEALGEVWKKASAQVNLSRLQLALQGLESETPATRVAVLGLNVQDTARRLVRLLLADALEDEGSWEKHILDSTTAFSHGLVIRYGQPPNPNLPQPRTSTPILYVPSAVLLRNNMEILVSTIRGLGNGELLQGAHTVTADAFLSPSVGTPTAASGRQVTINQPVHSTLLVTNGLDELLAAAELLASTNFVAPEDRKSVQSVVNLEGIKPRAPGQVLIVDATKAEEGLAAIRRSVTEARTYEHKWIDSGLPSLTTWLTSASAARSDEPIPAPVKTLISSVLTNATRNLQAQAALEQRSNAARSINYATKAKLENLIEEFSRNAHQELQSGLSSAWRSRNWRKLAWYKLFWRVDDVGLIITDLVTNAWLPRTERAVYEISGRFSQAGISLMDVSHTDNTSTLPKTEEIVEPSQVLQAQAGIATEPAIEPVVVNRAGKAEIEMAPIPRPVPLSSSISTIRATQIDRAITSLTSTAQQIVLKTLSLTGLSAGLSGLTYVSVAGSMYEAGTIVALGTAFALWRMQTDWLNATKSLETGLHEEGKTLIRRIVGRMRDLVEQGSKIVEDEVEVRTRREAEDAVLRAKEELERLK